MLIKKVSRLCVSTSSCIFNQQRELSKVLHQQKIALRLQKLMLKKHNQSFGNKIIAKELEHVPLKYVRVVEDNYSAEFPTYGSILHKSVQEMITGGLVDDLVINVEIVSCIMKSRSALFVWKSQGEERDKEINDILYKKRKVLRYNLINSYVSGKIPSLQFAAVIVQREIKSENDDSSSNKLNTNVSDLSHDQLMLKVLNMRKT